VSFNLTGANPYAVADALDQQGIESRAGCHCATLAHRALALDPPATCRLSFALYNTTDDIDRATAALSRTASTQRHRAARAGPAGLPTRVAAAVQGM
jgi:cysteine desulfurase/selenocysteine lyase